MPGPPHWLARQLPDGFDVPKDEARRRETRGLSWFRRSGTYDGGTVHRCLLGRLQTGVINPPDMQKPGGGTGLPITSPMRRLAEGCRGMSAPLG
jgi:hypothetical protein